MSAAGSLVSVSVDLDAVECYHRIHALPGEVPAAARHLILRRCLPRFVTLFARHGVKATFFVVGRDLADDEEGRALLAQLARAGHELGNHSHNHPYDLVRLETHLIAREIADAHAAIAAAAGTPPVGFRAPGYEISAAVIAHLIEQGYRYDSSVFPSVPYYLAKAGLMGAMRLLGRKSGSILGTPRVLAAPCTPYRPASGDPYQRGHLPIIELPMAVTGVLRLPVIGTALITAPELLRRQMVAAALKRPFFNLELHGIDLADATGDGFPAPLVAKQPDLRTPLARKLAALDATLAQATAAGASFAPLRDALATLNVP